MRPRRLKNSSGIRIGYSTERIGGRTRLANMSMDPPQTKRILGNGFAAPTKVVKGIPVFRLKGKSLIQKTKEARLRRMFGVRGK